MSRHISDLKAPNTFGAISNVPVGTLFSKILEASRAGVHRHSAAGIHGNSDLGCYSVVLSGGHEDDVDEGESFIYTGEGGRNLKGAKANQKNLLTADHFKDQVLARGNLALSRNVENNLPVRVLRGYKLKSKYAPVKGYRYDGLYKVIEYHLERGKSGCLVYKFKFERLENQEPAPWSAEFKNERVEELESKLKEVKQDTALECIQGLDNPRKNLENCLEVAVNDYCEDSSGTSPATSSSPQYGNPSTLSFSRSLPETSEGSSSYSYVLLYEKDPEKRISILQDSMAAIREKYMALNAEVIAIENKLKETRKVRESENLKNLMSKKMHHIKDVENPGSKQNLKNENCVLKDSMKSDLEDQIRCLNEEHNTEFEKSSDFGTDTININKKPQEKKKEPVTVTGPYIVYNLPEKDILEDWETITQSENVEVYAKKECVLIYRDVKWLNILRVLPKEKINVFFLKYF